MTTPKNNEPTEHDENDAAKKKLYDMLPDFWKGYIGVVGGDDDPNYGTYRVSASKTGEEFADIVWEKHRRIKAEFDKYLREKEQQTNNAD